MEENVVYAVDETAILKSIEHTEPETLKEAIKAMMETASNCLLKGGFDDAAIMMKCATILAKGLNKK
jgi:hypothetical protein